MIKNDRQLAASRRVAEELRSAVASFPSKNQQSALDRLQA